MKFFHLLIIRSLITLAVRIWVARSFFCDNFINLRFHVALTDLWSGELPDILCSLLDLLNLQSIPFIDLSAKVSWLGSGYSAHVTFTAMTCKSLITTKSRYILIIMTLRMSLRAVSESRLAHGHHTLISIDLRRCFSKHLLEWDFHLGPLNMVLMDHDWS